MSKFKVGDKIIGNSGANGNYCQTITGWKGTVTAVRDGRFDAKSLDNGINFGSLDEQYFDLLESSSYIVGQWYKNEHGHYGKFSHLGTWFHTSEHSLNGINFEGPHGFNHNYDWKPVPQEEMDKLLKKDPYIVGKWYKTQKGSYVKYSHTSGSGGFMASEYILYDDLEYVREVGGFGFALPVSNFTLLPDLSPIQKYLPAGHPDKYTPDIPKELEKVGDLVIVTKNYAGNSSKEGYIARLLRYDGSDVPYEVESVITQGEFYEGCETWCLDVRKATQHEIDTMLGGKKYESSEPKTQQVEDDSKTKFKCVDEQTPIIIASKPKKSSIKVL